MAFYAWTQQVPIDAAAYAEIAGRMGEAPMPGLVVHLALEDDDHTVRYIDVWESERTCNAALASVVHPAVGPVLARRRIEVQGEPVRTPLNVIDVRFADGTSLPG